MSIVDRKKSKAYILNQFWQGIKKDRLSYARLMSSIIIGYGMKFVRSKEFNFGGKTYRYFYHPYNHTWVNERAVEIPIVRESVLQNRTVLEIGNVLKHYYPFEHDVVDKYENGRGIVNQDVVDFSLGKKYDLIISISTMEHVGWDEEVKDRYKIPKSIENLKRHLNDNGKIVITVPLKYNPFLDELIVKGAFSNIRFLKREPLGVWHEVSLGEVKDASYLEGVSARVLGVITITK
jgi:SAM-dependent methyltransferase